MEGEELWKRSADTSTRAGTSYIVHRVKEMDDYRDKYVAYDRILLKNVRDCMVSDD